MLALPTLPTTARTRTCGMANVGQLPALMVMTAEDLLYSFRLSCPPNAPKPGSDSRTVCRDERDCTGAVDNGTGHITLRQELF